MRTLVVAIASGCSFTVNVGANDAPVPADAEPTDGARDVPTTIDATPAAFAMTGQRWLLPCTSLVSDSYACSCGGPQIQSVQLTGSASEHWMVTVRIRGAMEAIGYTGGAANSDGWVVGGAPSDTVNNYYEMAVTSPPQNYFLNNGVPAAHSYSYDYTASFPVDGDATIVFEANGQDGLQWANDDADQQPITFSGVTTNPQPYDGQFAQLDVLSVEPR
jgi:hypothetical protein